MLLSWWYQFVCVACFVFRVWWLLYLCCEFMSSLLLWIILFWKVFRTVDPNNFTVVDVCSSIKNIVSVQHKHQTCLFEFWYDLLSHEGEYNLEVSNSSALTLEKLLSTHSAHLQPSSQPAWHFSSFMLIRSKTKPTGDRIGACC